MYFKLSLILAGNLELLNQYVLNQQHAKFVISFYL